MSTRSDSVPSCRRFIWIVLLLALGSPAFCAPASSFFADGPLAVFVPWELNAYIGAKKVTRMKPKELASRFPELSQVRFSRNQQQLPALLEKIGERVTDFMQTISSVGSVEEVHQKCDSVKKDSPCRIVPKLFEFLYLISPRGSGPDVELLEYRTDKQGNPVDQSRLDLIGLVTNGYVSQSLLFHPRSRSVTEFRLLGQESPPPHSWVIALAQKPEAGSMTGSFEVGNKRVLLLLQGFAWVDPQTWMITRLSTDLLAPRRDVKLLEHKTKIEYFTGGLPAEINPNWWLPKEVHVTVHWGEWRFFNRHRYKNYKLFSVDARIRYTQ